MSGPAALTGPRKCFDSFDQLEEGTKMLRKGKNSEKKKKKWEEWIQPILASIPFFFFLEEGAHESHTEALVMGAP